MDQFIAQFLIPVLGFITILFIYVAWRSYLIDRKQSEHVGLARQHFDYTSAHLESVDSNVKEIHQTIQKDVIPKVNQVYTQLAQSALPLNPSSVRKCLEKAGVTTIKSLTPDESLLFFGSQLEDGSRKTSHLVAIRGGDQIDIIVFALAIDDPTPEFLAELLRVNSLISVGKFGMLRMAKRTIVTVEHTILTPSGFLEAEEFLGVIRRLQITNQALWELMERHSVKSTEWLINDFVKNLDTDFVSQLPDINAFKTLAKTK